MQDKELYENILGLKKPWSVTEVDLQMLESKVTVTLSHDPMVRFP
jgi:hypothetical protein